MIFVIDSFDGNLNRKIKRNTNDKTLIIILHSIKTTYAKCCVYDVKKYMKNISICQYCHNNQLDNVSQNMGEIKTITFQFIFYDTLSC